MGLIYQFPVQENHLDDCINTAEGRIRLTNYSLPTIFWFYFASLLMLLIIMCLAMASPMQKLMQSNDFFDQLLASITLALMFFLPLVGLGFFGYQKAIDKKGPVFTVTHKIFGVICRRQKIVLSHPQALVIKHHLDSPNLAAQNQAPEMRAFQNRGYHQLFAQSADGKHYLIDRHSQLGEMKKLRRLLMKY